jgi:hypothetical protein
LWLWKTRICVMYSTSSAKSFNITIRIYSYIITIRNIKKNQLTTIIGNRHNSSVRNRFAFLNRNFSQIWTVFAQYFQTCK